MNEKDAKAMKILEILRATDAESINDYTKYLGVDEIRRKLKSTVRFALPEIRGHIAELESQGLIARQVSANYGDRYKITPEGIKQ